jgi:hypothetical protein
MYFDYDLRVRTWTDTGTKLNTVTNALPITLRYRFKTKNIAEADTGLLHMFDISMSTVNIQS